MISAWMIIGIVFSLLAALGAGTDRLLLHRHKTAFQTRLIKWWCDLEDLNLPHIPRKTVESTLSVLQRWPLLSWKFLAASLIGSCLLTTLAYVVGASLDPWQKLFSLPTAAVYAANYVCDITTFLITLKILRLLKGFGAIRGLFFVLADVALAVLLAITAHSLNTWADQYMFNQDWSATARVTREEQQFARNALSHRLVEDGLGRNALLRVINKKKFFEYMQDAPSVFLDVLSLGVHHKLGQYTVVATGNGLSRSYVLERVFLNGWASVLQDWTTLLPTLFYMSVFTVLLIGWSLLRAAQQLTKLLLERVTEDPPEKFAPFSLLGILLGSIAAIATAIVKVVSIITS